MLARDLAHLSPFHDRPDEWELYEPLPPAGSMLELGDKRNRELTYKAFFEALGWRHVSVDWNGEHGALKLDLRKPLELGVFDVVTNIGTSEHVSEQVPCWRNMVEAVRLGGILISTTPLRGDWWWHGEWYPMEEFYNELALLNGFTIERLYIANEAPRRMWFCRMKRTDSIGERFIMADGMWHNVIRPR